jgi:hypothetical protein
LELFGGIKQRDLKAVFADQIKNKKNGKKLVFKKYFD